MMVRVCGGPAVRLDGEPATVVVVNVLDPVREIQRRYFPYLKNDRGVDEIQAALAQVEQGEAWLLRATMLTLERLAASGAKDVTVGEAAALPQGMQAMLRERWPQG
jgi:hypothetical protein